MSAQLSSFVDHSTTSCAAPVLCESLSLTPSWESSEGERGRSWILSARAIAKDKTQRGANSSSSLQRICSAGPQVAQRGGFFGRCGHSSPGPRWFFVCSGVSVTKNSSQTRLEEPEPPPRGIPAGLSGEMEPLSRGPRCARGEAGDRNNPRAHRSAQGMAQFPGGKEETGHPPKPLPALIRTRIVPQTHPKTWSSERLTHPSSHSSTNVVFERSLCCKAG